MGGEALSKDIIRSKYAKESQWDHPSRKTVGLWDIFIRKRPNRAYWLFMLVPSSDIPRLSGQSTHFWNDPWLSDIPYKIRISRLF